MITISRNLMEQKIEKISSNMHKIKENLTPDTPPIFVELLGTPKSGKTTLLKNLRGLFGNNNIEIFTRRETAEYNPVAKDAKEYNLWMVLELFRNLSEDISNKQGKIVIYDRGILDRLTWLERAVETGEMSKADFEKIRALYELETIKIGYRPITLGFITTPELSVQRKGQPGRAVNVENLTAYNRILLSAQNEIEKISFTNSLTRTDTYQGRLEEFILDISSKLTDEIINSLEIGKNKQAKSVKESIGEGR